MQSITTNDQAVALSDAFRCVVKELDEAGVLKIADLVKAMQVQANSPTRGPRRWRCRSDCFYCQRLEEVSRRRDLTLQG